ncbi:MAG TPA: hypothetical protein DCS93_40665 [Microscillaceae bacterium]|nr:hypothetical protein [Microscillaceae bacterium]
MGFTLTKPRTTSRDYVRIGLVFTGALAQVVMGAIPNIMGWQFNVGMRSREVQTLAVPATYAFAIWSVLFLGCILFAIVQMWPIYQRDKTLRTVGWLAAIAFWGNTFWEWYVPFNSFGLGSLVLIFIIFIALISAMFVLQDRKDRRPLFIPLKMLCGWISVATLVNISVTANFLSFNPFALSPHLQALIIIITAGLVTIGVAIYFKSAYYNFPTLWGLVAIYVININRQETQLAYWALVLGIVGFLVALIGQVWVSTKR